MGIIRVRASRRAKAHTRQSSLRVLKANAKLVDRIYQYGVENARGRNKNAVYAAMKTVAKKRVIADTIFSTSSQIYRHGPSDLHGRLNKKRRSSAYFGNK